MKIQKQKQVSSTNKDIFEDMIKRASQPLEVLEKTESRDGCACHTDKKTRSRSFVNTSGKRHGKSR